MSPVSGLQPVSTLAGSTLEVEVSEVLELAGLGNVSLVVGLLLVGLLLSKGGVLVTAQTIRDVGSSSEAAFLDFLHSSVGENRARER